MGSKYGFTAVSFLLFCVSAYGIQVSAPELFADLGSTVTVEISVDNATGIAGGDIVLEYNPAILVVRDARATDLIQRLSPIVNAGITGEIVVTMASINGLTGGSGAILEVDFEVIAAGESPLVLSDVALYNEVADDIAVTVVNGSVTALGPPPELPDQPRVLSISNAAKKLISLWGSIRSRR